MSKPPYEYVTDLVQKIREDISHIKNKLFIEKPKSESAETPRQYSIQAKHANHDSDEKTDSPEQTVRAVLTLPESLRVDAETHQRHTRWYQDRTFVLSLGGVLVGGIVAAIYWGQLTQMVESNRINRENMESTQRALVFFSGQVGYVKRFAGKKITSLTLVLPWENSGVTPAIDGDSRVNWKTFQSPTGIPEGFSYPDEGNVERRQFDIPPRGYGNGTEDVPIEWIEATKDNSLRLFVHGWITYDDIFKGKKGERITPRHLSEFCDEITNIKSSPDDVTDPAANITWELSLCPEHNCSDERCKDYSTKIKQ